LITSLSDSNEDVRKADLEALKALIEAGIVTKEEARKEAKEKRVLEALITSLSDSNEDVRKADLEALKALIEAGIVTKEEVFNREEIKNMFEEVYGKGISGLRHFHYYLKFLSILKDNPTAAYQIFDWSLEELLELFQIFDYFVKGALSDPSYKAKGNEKYFLEKELIKNNLIFIKEPQIFISNLKERIKTTISDNSVKLAIKVHEIASVNAARGLIKALGKDNVIILYDREIDSEQAERFFPGYNIRAYSGFSEKNSIKIEFCDYGNMRIQSSNINTNTSIYVSLPYTPFKFNLPERVSEEELNKMKESLNITSRKVIVIGSPSDREFDDFMQSYNSLYANLPHGKRPLIISGFRKRRNESELEFLGSLSGQSIVVRSDDNAPLPDIENNNVLILNTSGELLRMYALADVAIVGNDRNIFEPASQEAAVLYFEGSWYNNLEAKEVLVKTSAAQKFSRENLKRLIDSRHESEGMAKKGLEAVSTYKKKVQSKTEEFALQIIGIRAQLRDKFITSLPIAIEKIIFNLKSGVPLSHGQLSGIGFDNSEALFVWLNSKISENAQLMSELQHFDRNDRNSSGGQSSLLIDPVNREYALKVVEQNFNDMLIANTIKAFKLSQERLGGLATPFFLPSDFDAKREAVVQLVSPLTGEDIRKKGKAFVDEYLLLIETYWQRGVFDHDFKLDGLGIVGEQERLIVLDFGLSEDILDEGLFIEPDGKDERFWNTFNIAIDKLHNTRDKLKRVSPDIAEHFEDQLKRRYEIELLPSWNRDMRSGDEATELAKKLREAVKRFRPQLATPNYVFPFIGGEFDRFIALQLQERYDLYNILSEPIIDSPKALKICL
ncbi:MAG: hypothetical protein KJ706_05400, partial [Candidatus Omnitrophica bacterium]|nr:hypothetical protein [Candidatus Omnitrophota bacterium]